ncbi:MAG: MoxR family ATPase [Sulfuricurvum sp.]|uniref:AAA family ATPase n=1 Tax=Sulfuricurvum sp. TaxID=2025608 RepID=UPI0025FEFE8C|nr:MoxR family ATPase [Sulfuricurvum sp.]MCK9371797.1 MoxR family ATPase [Sulfuricurvum sp.]
MRTSETITTMRALIESKIPTFLWGPPGIGKSSIVKQIALREGIACIDLRLSLMDPTDLKGIPFYEQGSRTALWAPPSFLPKEGKGILFLDELNSAAPAVQASAYQLILDRKVGEYTLPEGWAIVAAGNREGDRGVVYRLPSPLANRFVHIEMEVNVSDWRDWAIGRGIDERILAYIGFKNEALFGFDPTRNERSFATPRSWEAVHAILNSPLPQNLLLDTITGAIGREGAVDFLGFCKVMSLLPDIDAILRGEEGGYPSDVSALYALSSALVSRILRNPEEETIESLLRYTLNLQSEFAVMIVQDLQRQGILMDHLDAYGEWVDAYAYLLC